MYITVKCNYGHRTENGIIDLKTPKSAPFEVSDEKGEELIRRKIAVKAEMPGTPAAPVAGDGSKPSDTGSDLSNKPLEEMTSAELKEVAKSLGIPSYGSMSKEALRDAITAKRAEEGATPQPEIDANSGIQ